jgi:hypothetical protein
MPPHASANQNGTSTVAADGNLVFLTFADRHIETGKLIRARAVITV